MDARDGRSSAADIEGVARLLVERRHGLALTGAGISVDSGIPDFRSPEGLWQRYAPMEYATIEAFNRNPEKVWAMLRELSELLRRAEPNPGHRALARLEELGLLDGVVTQNVDNLHQRAGSRNVVEFHGNGATLRCRGCGSSLDAERARKLLPVPRCGCGAVLKPDVIFFGEAIPSEALRRSNELALCAGVVLVVGTSATVTPASLIPLLAQQADAALAEFNLEPTELTSSCEFVCHGNASDTLPALVERVEALLR